MNEVFEKTRALGEALLNSDEYKAVKTAEDKAMGNPEAANAVGRLMELRSKMEALMSQNEKDWAEVQKLNDEIEECRRYISAIEVMAELDKARENFGNLIQQVNNVLQFIVTGEMTNGADGCTGSCSTCGGACGRVN